jgi:hypothetical protein
MAIEWYYVKGCTAYGPVTSKQLRSLVVKGKIQETDHVWHGGLPDW